jgi:hypothetical protein
MSRLWNLNNALAPEPELRVADLKGYAPLVCGALATSVSAKTHLQHIMTAVAMNLVRLMHWWEELPKALASCLSISSTRPRQLIRIRPWRIFLLLPEESRFGWNDPENQDLGVVKALRKPQSILVVMR